MASRDRIAQGKSLSDPFSLDSSLTLLGPLQVRGGIIGERPSSRSVCTFPLILMLTDASRQPESPREDRVSDPTSKSSHSLNPCSL